jgi:hypothetical protein
MASQFIILFKNGTEIRAVETVKDVAYAAELMELDPAKFAAALEKHGRIDTSECIRVPRGIWIATTQSHPKTAAAQVNSSVAALLGMHFGWLAPPTTPIFEPQRDRLERHTSNT